MTTALRIDVVDRCAALELSRRLAAFRTYVVQCGRDRWYVAVDHDGNPDGVTAEVLDALEAWVAAGGTECVLHHGARTYPLRAPAAF